jgi:hypothetical protein
VGARLREGDGRIDSSSFTGAGTRDIAGPRRRRAAEVVDVDVVGVVVVAAARGGRRRSSSMATTPPRRPPPPPDDDDDMTTEGGGAGRRHPDATVAEHGEGAPRRTHDDDIEEVAIIPGRRWRKATIGFGIGIGGGGDGGRDGTIQPVVARGRERRLPRWRSSRRRQRRRPSSSSFGSAQAETSR